LQQQELVQRETERYGSTVLVDGGLMWNLKEQ